MSDRSNRLIKLYSELSQAVPAWTALCLPGTPQRTAPGPPGRAPPRPGERAQGLRATPLPERARKGGAAATGAKFHSRTWCEGRGKEIRKKMRTWRHHRQAFRSAAAADTARAKRFQILAGRCLAAAQQPGGGDFRSRISPPPTPPLQPAVPLPWRRSRRRRPPVPQAGGGDFRAGISPPIRGGVCAAPLPWRRSCLPSSSQTRTRASWPLGGSQVEASGITRLQFECCSPPASRAESLMITLGAVAKE